MSGCTHTCQDTYTYLINSSLGVGRVLDQVLKRHHVLRLLFCTLRREAEVTEGAPPPREVGGPFLYQPPASDGAQPLQRPPALVDEVGRGKQEVGGGCWDWLRRGESGRGDIGSGGRVVGADK